MATPLFSVALKAPRCVSVCVRESAREGATEGRKGDRGGGLGGRHRNVSVTCPLLPHSPGCVHCFYAHLVTCVCVCVRVSVCVVANSTRIAAS